MQGFGDSVPDRVWGNAPIKKGFGALPQQKRRENNGKGDT